MNCIDLFCRAANTLLEGKIPHSPASLPFHCAFRQCFDTYR